MSNHRLEVVPVGRNATRKLMVHMANLLGIPRILLVSTHTKIFPTVIIALSIFVIHLLSDIKRDTHQNDNHPMAQQDAVWRDANTERPAGIVRSGDRASVSGIPSPHRHHAFEVSPRPLLPFQYSRQRIVVETPLEKLPWRQRLDETRGTDNTDISFNTHAAYGFEVSGTGRRQPTCPAPL